MKTADLDTYMSCQENLSAWCMEVGSRFEHLSYEAAFEFFVYHKTNKIKNFYVVDLGAGDGAASNLFIDIGFITTSVDINEEKLSQIVSGRPVVMDMYEYVRGVDRLDNVFTHHSLEHTVNAAEIIEEIGKKLDPDAIYYAAVPANDTLHSVHHTVFESWKELVPPNCDVIMGGERMRLIEPGYFEQEYVCIARKTF